MTRLGVLRQVEERAQRERDGWARTVADAAAEGKDPTGAGFRYAVAMYVEARQRASFATDAAALECFGVFYASVTVELIKSWRGYHVRAQAVQP